MAINVEQWQVYEFELSSTVSYENPYYEIDVDVTFSGPNGESITHPAFWNGDDRWGVRFAPISLGDWTYVTSCSDPDNAGLTGQTGAITCVAYIGDKKIYQQGWLKKIDGERFLFYDDGTPFYWLGDTHWNFAILERWDESNKEGFDSQFRGMVDKRVSQEFTIYQSNLLGSVRTIEAESDANGFFVENTTFQLINIEFFQNDIDLKMAYIAQQGLVNVLGFAWNTFLYTDYVEQMKRFARYIVARYGAYPMIWSIVGEGAEYPNSEILMERWREIALEVKQVDGFRHLITIHYSNERPLPTYYVGESWLDFVLGQMGHANESMHVSNYANFFEEFPDIPYVEGEAMYEYLLTLEYPGRRLGNAKLVRHAAYRAIQSGCCGYTYGAQGIWNALWNSDEPVIESNDVFWGTTDWRTAIDSETPDQLTYMKHFYENLPWNELKSRDDIFSAYAGVAHADYAPNVTAKDDLSVIVYFCSDRYSNIRTTWQMQNLPDATYSIMLFNPRTGEMTDSGQISAENGSFLVPSVPTEAEDWLWLFEII